MRTTVLIFFILISMSRIAVADEHAELLNANLADKSVLQSAPGISAAVANAIVDGRPYLTAMRLDDHLHRLADSDGRREVYKTVFRPLNLNTAPREEIMLIPGMSKRMAHEFEEYRPYTSIEQFRREIGKYVDDDEVARLEQYVFVPVGLNSASADEIMAIPGMTKRMVHEFEEYRPYTSMEQFRREIGKYVDEDEVARLESYVTLD